MNNKEGTLKKSGARPTSSRPSSNKPNLRCKKGTRAKKSKINTKVAEVVSTRLKKNRIRQSRDAKDEICLNKYIANSGACSRRG
jgi:23S rRNA pseudouridine2605 synthase